MNCRKFILALVSLGFVAAASNAFAANKTYTNAFGGTVTLTVADRFVADDKKAFLITYPKVPQEACIDLAAQDWDASSGSGLIAMGINESVATKYYPCTTNESSAAGKGTVCGGQGAMKVGVAAVACKAGTDNTLYFKYF